MGHQAWSEAAAVKSAAELRVGDVIRTEILGDWTAIDAVTIRRVGVTTTVEISMADFGVEEEPYLVAGDQMFLVSRNRVSE